MGKIRAGDLRSDTNVLTSLVGETTTDYLPLSGGTLTGSLSVDGDLTLKNELRLIDTNYYQSSSKTLSGVYNFSGRNSFIQAEQAVNGQGNAVYGPACTGSKGFVILGIDVENKKLKLSGDIGQISAISGDAFSYSFADAAGTSCLTITSVDTESSESCGFVVVENLTDGLIKYANATELSCIQMFEDDDNGLYCPKNPTIGNVILENFYGSHAEGGSTRAIGKYTHAEGRDATADIRYAHAEGSHTFAGGMGSHAEGFGSAANKNIALGQGSHSEGCKSIALGQASHAEGGPQQYVELGTSVGNMAIGDSCHVEGGGNNYSGSRCFNVLGVYGLSKVRSGDGRRAPDVVETENTIKLDSVTGLEKLVGSKVYYSIRLDCNYDFIGRIMSVDTVDNTISCDNIPTGDNAVFCGNRYDQLWIPTHPELGTYTLGYGAHAEGFDTKACQNGAHSEGTETMAAGKYSHAEGNGTVAGWSAHAEGVNCKALGDASHAAGQNAIAGELLPDGRIQKHFGAYVWSGTGGTYYSHGDRTFNINPTGGIYGFYVGNQGICDSVVLHPQNDNTIMICNTQDDVDLCKRQLLTSTDYNSNNTRIVDFVTSVVWKYDSGNFQKEQVEYQYKKPDGTIETRSRNKTPVEALVNFRGRLSNNKITKKLFLVKSDGVTQFDVGSSSLVGKTYDLGTGVGTLSAIADIIAALGGTAIVPTETN